jgi:hypothetical protein
VAQCRSPDTPVHTLFLPASRGDADTEPVTLQACCDAITAALDRAAQAARDAAAAMETGIETQPEAHIAPATSVTAGVWEVNHRRLLVVHCVAMCVSDVPACPWPIPVSLPRPLTSLTRSPCHHSPPHPVTPHPVTHLPPATGPAAPSRVRSTSSPGPRQATPPRRIPSASPARGSSPSPSQPRPFSLHPRPGSAASVHSSHKDEDDDSADDDDGSVVVPTVVRVKHMSAGLGGAGTPSPTSALARPWSKGAPEGHPGMTRVVGEGGTAAVDVRRTPVRLPRVEPVQGVAAPGGSDGVVSRYARWPSVGTSPVIARTGASGAGTGGGKQTSSFVGVHVRVRVCVPGTASPYAPSRAATPSPSPGIGVQVVHLCQRCGERGYCLSVCSHGLVCCWHEDAG